MPDNDFDKLIQHIASEYVLDRIRYGARDGLKYDLTKALERMSSVGRLSAALQGMPEINEETFRGFLQELDTLPWAVIERACEEYGIIEALEQHGRQLVEGLRIEHLPEQDWELLEKAGLSNAKACMATAISGPLTAEGYLVPQAESLGVDPVRSLSTAREVLSRAQRTSKGDIRRAGRIDQAPPIKRRKWFRGVTRIVAGGAGAAGNVALGIGAIPVAAPIGAAAVLSSCTGALVLIGDGIEALSSRDF